MAKKHKKVYDIKENIATYKPNNQWFINVGKSMGFTATELVKELMPVTENFIDTNASDTKEMIAEFRENFGGKKALMTQIKRLPHIKIANEALQNAKADFKSGNFYNKREMSFDDDDFSMGGIDPFGDDDGLMFDDDDDFEFSGVQRSGDVNVIDTMPLARVVNAGTAATVNTMVNVAEQQMAIELEKMTMSHRTSAMMENGMNMINANLATLVKFNSDSTANYHAASLKYYEESLELLKNLNDGISGKRKEDNNKALDDSLDDLYTSEGNIKIKAYANRIKSNLEDAKDENMFLSMASTVLSDTTLIKQFASNPIGTMMKMVGKGLLPKATKAALASFDETIGAIIPAIIARVNTLEDSDNPILNYIYKTFNTKAKMSSSADLSKYEKGPIQWDGESKKALVEVIPAYLRRIESILSGKEERIFDFDKGTFSTRDKMKENYEKTLNYKKTSGYSDVSFKLRSIVSNMGATMDTMDQFNKDLEEYLIAMTEKGYMINPFPDINDGDYTSELEKLGLFGGDEQRIELFLKALGGLSKSDMAKLFSSNISDSRRNVNKYMNDIEKNSSKDNYNILFNDKTGIDPKIGLKMGLGERGPFKDKFNLSSLDYLRDIRGILLNGVIVYPQRSINGRQGGRNFNPNADIITRVGEENSAYQNRLLEDQRIRERENQRQQRNFNYFDLNNIEDEVFQDAVNKAYEKEDERNGENGNRKFGRAVFKNFTNKLNKVTEIIDDEIYAILFGQKADKMFRYDEEEETRDGERKSVIMSAIGFFGDSFKAFGHYFTGQGYTKMDGTVVPPNDDAIMGKVRSFFTGAWDKLTKGEGGGLIGKFSNDFMDGYYQFRRTLFGDKATEEGKGRETLGELMNTVKSRLPKALGYGLAGAAIKTVFASHLGLLGSILLPGGPLGAALVGTTFGFLKQSETFNKWLYGDIGEDGQRIGNGFMPSSVVKAMGEYGPVIKKGAAVGALASFFLPGGPVLGAILGAGAGIASKSDAFQEFLFGKDFDDKDNRSMMNGAFGKLYKNTIGDLTGDKDGKRAGLATFLGASGVGIGLAQGVGLLPSFLLPGGPIVGALFGLAGGIAASSNKFQEWLFGEEDVDGKRYGGVLTKFRNWMTDELLNPIKLKLMELNDRFYGFMRKNVFDPIAAAFDPIKQAGIFMLQDIKESIKESFNNVTKPIVDAVKDNIIKPIAGAVKKLLSPVKWIMKAAFKLVGGLVKGVVTAPIKMLTGIGNMADAYNERHVIRDEKKARRQAAADAWGDENVSLGDKLKATGRMFMSSKEKRRIADEKLGYRQKNKERQQATEDAIAARGQKRQDLAQQFEEDRKFAKENKYKYASEKAKKKREEELREKEAWLMEKQYMEAQETNEKIDKMTSFLEEIKILEDDGDDTLKDLRDLAENILKQLKGNKSSDVEDAINKGEDALRSGSETAQKLGEKLREMGQSHAKGLDSVPEDGYIAELHQGEMVVPKGPAGFMRNMFKGGKNMFTKWMNKDKKDRGDNALGLSDEEAAQAKELKDREEKAHVSRKSADYILNEREKAQEKKAEQEWRGDVLSGIASVTSAINSQQEKKNPLWEMLKNGLSSMLGGLGNMLGNMLGGTGGVGGLVSGAVQGAMNKLGLTGILSALAYYLLYKQHKNYGEIADEYGIEEGDVWLGTRPERIDAEGNAIFDNQLPNIGKHIIQAPKAFFKPVTAAGEMVYDAGKSIWESGAKVFNKVRPPKPAGTPVAGEILDASGKPLAKLTGSSSDDVIKVAMEGKKGLLGTLIDLGKKAVTALGDMLVKKFPKLGKLTGIMDDVFKKILGSADNVMAKFGSKIAFALGKGGTTSIPVAGQVLQICLSTYDFVSGISKGNTGNMFGVAEDHVDAIMRGICGVLQVAFGLSWMSVVWIINEITTSMFGINFIQTFARKIYALLTPKEMTDAKFSNQLDPSKDYSRAAIDTMLEDAGIVHNKVDNFKNKDGTWKDFSKMKPEDLEGTGISTDEWMTISRLQYNQKNKTNISEDAWVDMQSKTLGTKIWERTKDNASGYTNKGVSEAMGLNENAKASVLERLVYGSLNSTANKVGILGDILGIDALSNMTDTLDSSAKKYGEWRSNRNQEKLKKSDEKELKYKEKANESDSWLGQKYYETLSWWNWRKGEKLKEKEGIGKTKQEKKLDKLKEKELMYKEKANESNSWLGQKWYETASWWNWKKGQKIKKKQEKKNKKNAKKEAAKKMQQKNAEAWGDFQYNPNPGGALGNGDFTIDPNTGYNFDPVAYGFDPNNLSENDLVYMSLLQQASTDPNWANNMTGDAGMGEGEDTNATKLPKAQPSNNSGVTVQQAVLKATENATKSINSMYSTMTKSITKSSSTIKDGFNKGNNELNKAFKDTNKTLTKVYKDVRKKMEKDNKKYGKDLEKGNKNLLKDVNKIVDTIEDKVEKTVKNLKNVKVGAISNITPSFVYDETFVGSVFEKIFGKGDGEDGKSIFEQMWKTFKEKINAGSSGVGIEKPNRRLIRAESPKLKPANHTGGIDTIRPSKTNNKFVFYNQADPRWGSNPMGNKTLKEAGCGPTSLAMAISQLTGEKITPDTVAELGKEHLPGFSSVSLFPSVANKLKMNYAEADSKDRRFITDKLRQGLPVMLSGRSISDGSPYTPEGHVVTASEIRGNKIFIQDPRGKEYSGYYPLSAIMGGLNKAMVVSPSSSTKYVKLPSMGKFRGLSKGRGVNSPYGFYGDPDVTDGSDINLGRAGAGQVRVIDRVLSYMRAFLSSPNKMIYSQPKRQEIYNNGNHADCSSFVSHVLTVAGDTGKTYNETSQSFWDNVGTKVSEPQVGDVVCQEGHVGLYSGDGMYIHMNGKGVNEAKHKQRGNNPHRGYKRVLQNPEAMVDATITNGNSLIGTVTATNTGTPVLGGGGNGGPQASLENALLIGDSLTIGMEPVLEGKYPNAIAMGKGGKWAHQWLDSLGELPDASKVGTVIQWLGINGVHANKQNIEKSQKLLTKLKEKYPGKPIFNMRIFPTTEKYGYNGYKGEWWRGLSQEFNSAMSSWCGSNGVNYLDATNGYILDDGYLDPSKAVDGIHMTTDGYKGILANMETAIQGYNASNTNGATGGASGGASAADPMGVFGKLSNISQNVMASIFNGKWTDLFAGSTSTDTTSPSNPVDIGDISDNAQAVWTFFRSRGYSPHATAGIMGNLQQESGMDPKIKQHGGGPGRGICQWTVSEERFKGLEAHAKSKGKDWTDLQSQLEWLEMELNGKDVTTKQKMDKNYGGLENFKKATDVVWAVEAFEKSFERAGIPNYPRRNKFAQEFFDKFNNSETMDAGSGPATATSAETYSGSGTPTSMNGWAYYKQGDPQWQEDISGKKIGPSGCGMASHAMMLTTMFGKQITPVTVGKWARKNGHWSNGMSWSMPPAVAKLFNLDIVKNEGNDGGLPNSSLANLKEQIKAGYPAILSGKSGGKAGSPFTSGGHIVLGVGVDGNNNVIINDPRGADKTRAYTDEEMMYGPGLRGYWAFNMTSNSAIPSDWATGDAWNGNPYSSTNPGAMDSSASAAPAVNQMGVFGKVNDIAQNVMASIFNGKWTDLNASTTTDSTDTTTPSTGSSPSGSIPVDENLMYSSKDGFFQALLPGAQAAYQNYKVFPSTALAQAAHESDWGTSSVAKKNKNLFGIKYTGKFAPGITVTNDGASCPSNEQGGKRPYNKYQSFGDSVYDYGDFLKRNSFYKKMLAATDPKTQVVELGKSGYAEDKSYGTKIQNMVDTYNLTKYNSSAGNGKGDGKTYWAKGFSGDAGKGNGTSKVTYHRPNVGSIPSTQQVRQTKLAMERNIRDLERSVSQQPVTGRPVNGPAMTTACVELIHAILKELQNINHNTAETASNVKNIQIVSANEPIPKAKPVTGKPVSPAKNDKTGYDMARRIASYK